MARGDNRLFLLGDRPDTITWQSTSSLHDEHAQFHYRGPPENETSWNYFNHVSVRHLGEMRSRECIMCEITYRSCVLTHELSLPRQEKVKAFWNIKYPIYHASGLGASSKHGTIHLSCDGRDLRPVQLYYLPSSPAPPPWDFIKPMNHILQRRREEFQPLLARWIVNCNASDQPCHNIKARLPTRVIHVGDERNGVPPHLYTSSGEVGSYIALSHCWGKTKTVRLTKENKEILHEKIDMTALSKNFQDAIVIARAVGVSYLWIDSLCIIQGDEQDWIIESSRMATVYQDAYLVLAAAQAKDGSGGMVDPHDRFRREPVVVAKLRDNTLSECTIYARCATLDIEESGDVLSHKINETPWAGRVWTLQEALLARRIVYFTREELVWECDHGVQCECRQNVSVRNKETVSNARTLSTGAEMFDDWRQILSEVSSRDITYERDRLPALSGLAKQFQSRGAGTYLAGFWREDLLRSLLWYRDPYDRGKFKREDLAQVPTWSCFSIQPKGGGTRQPRIQMDNERFNGLSVQLVDAGCTPKGADPTGEVEPGFIVLLGKLALLPEEVL